MAATRVLFCARAILIIETGDEAGDRRANEY